MRELSDQLQQSITGMRIIKAFGMESHEEKGFQQDSMRFFRSNIKAAAILSSTLPSWNSWLSWHSFRFYITRMRAWILKPYRLGFLGIDLFALPDVRSDPEVEPHPCAVSACDGFLEPDCGIARYAPGDSGPDRAPATWRIPRIDRIQSVLRLIG